jgi:hypothetical protein
MPPIDSGLGRAWKDRALVRVTRRGDERCGTIDQRRHAATVAGKHAAFSRCSSFLYARPREVVGRNEVGKKVRRLLSYKCGIM